VLPSAIDTVRVWLARLDNGYKGIDGNCTHYNPKHDDHFQIADSYDRVRSLIPIHLSTHCAFKDCRVVKFYGVAPSNKEHMIKSSYRKVTCTIECSEMSCILVEFTTTERLLSI
jgi:hypothetical protein